MGPRGGEYLRIRPSTGRVVDSTLIGRSAGAEA